jgi:protein TonB
VSARAATVHLFGWPIWASVGAHGVIIVTVSTVATFAPAMPTTNPVPIEVVSVEPAAPPPPPERPKPQSRQKIAAPRLVTPPTELARPTPWPPAPLSNAPRRESVSPDAEPSDSSRRFLAGAAASSSWSMPGTMSGSSSGSGRLLSTGDLPVGGTPAGRGHGGGGGDGKNVAVGESPTGLTSFARPVGGYQTQPRYPDSARRQGIEGETLLRFQVLPMGRVTSVSVAKSAGHVDLDRAAMDAVKTWLFEPARRGKEAVAVWVTLPVRFQLHSGVVE